MTKRRNSLAFLATGFLVALTGQSAVALTINFTSPENVRPYRYYEDQDYYGYTWLTVPEPVTSGGSEEAALLGLLSEFSQQSIGNWQFEFASNDLEGSFDFNFYRACVPVGSTVGDDGDKLPEPCGEGILQNDPFQGVVGSEVTLEFNPTGNDPQLNSSFHWIQRVRSNHSINVENGHGIFEDNLDNDSSTVTPYYSTASSGFLDVPNRQDFLNNHNWDAELYLAQENTEITETGSLLHKLTIYDGIKYGWRNDTFLRRDPKICEAPVITGCISSPDIPIDLALVFDTTGSMGGSINDVKSLATQVVDNLFSEIPGSRIAVVDFKDFPVPPFGDPDDYPYRAVLPFSSEQTSIVNAINSLTVGGGYDIPESTYSALIRTIHTENLGEWRDDVKKAIIYVTDAPPHDPEPFTGYTATSVIDAAFSVDPAVIYSIVLDYSGSDTQNSLGRLSTWTGGKLFVAQNPDDVARGVFEAISDIREFTPIPQPESVPEPTSIWGLLMLAVYGMVQGVKSKGISSRKL